MFCAIWYHLYNLNNVKNTHGGVLLLVKLHHIYTKWGLLLLLFGSPVLLNGPVNTIMFFRPSIHPSICKIGSIALAHYFLIFCIKFLMLSKKKVEPIFLGKFLCLKCSKRGSFEPKINIFQKLYRMAGMKKLWNSRWKWLFWIFKESSYYT